jgi:D-tyrosyl-tRNA(Tyr) deacylase
MRAVIQRVAEAKVEVEGNQSAPAVMGPGLLVLLAAGQGDTLETADWMAEKIIGLRVFPDAQQKMNLGLSEVGGEMIVVSQFTLYGDCRKGRRPSFVGALQPEAAAPLIDRFAEEVRKRGIRCGTGVFGAHMRVTLVNEGPVTLLLDSAQPRRAATGGFGT